MLRVTSLLIGLLGTVNYAEAVEIIAHRGASGFLPEHTIASTVLAHAQSPDYIEQDVVLTKDGVPVVLHDIHLETVTDVETVFAGRARDDGRYYAIDFTLDELKQLRVHERQNQDGSNVFSTRFNARNVQFQIATLHEHIDVISELNRIRNTDIGLYIEIKSPAWHQQQGADPSRVVLEVLRNYNLHKPGDKVYLQCFDFDEVKRIRTELGYKGKLIALLGDNSWQESETDYDQLKTDDGMQTVAKYASGIGPWIGHLITQSVLADNHPPKWLEAAKRNGLLVHPYTFRTDALPQGFTDTQLLDTLIKHYAIDGLFTDQVPPVRAYLN